MKFTTLFAATTALATTAHATDEATSAMTLKYPGFTQTVPVGLDASSTQTITGWTVTRNTIIYSGVAVMTDASAIYMEDLSNTGNNAKGGIGPHDTNIVAGVTVEGGDIQTVDSTAAAATGSSSSVSATSSGGSAKPSEGSSSSPTASSTPSCGAGRLGGWRVVAVAGFVAAVSTL